MCAGAQRNLVTKIQRTFSRDKGEDRRQNLLICLPKFCARSDHYPESWKGVPEGVRVLTRMLLEVQSGCPQIGPGNWFNVNGVVSRKVGSINGGEIRECKEKQEKARVEAIMEAMKAGVRQVSETSNCQVISRQCSSDDPLVFCDACGSFESQRLPVDVVFWPPASSEAKGVLMGAANQRLKRREYAPSSGPESLARWCVAFASVCWFFLFS